ncbi:MULTISPECIES: ankyrin repeat domain-containing protein [unclassified Streptomyces]|uniref:ankyrin repeat domain-containing protein n=1 Tax=unclassified Streptomyces TaxID=2593676 RepID=UPI0033EF3117
MDALEMGVTALWEAVMSRRPDNALALAAAGADPWRELIGGWSPGRLSLAGPTPALFALPAGERGLSEAERTTAAEGARLVGALGTFHYEGTGLACVAGIDAAEAVNRLQAIPADRNLVEELLEGRYAYDMDETRQIIGLTTVPGGCVVTQPWGYTPSTPGVLTRLSEATLCYGVFANPKSGNQGSIARNGAIEGRGLHPGGAPDQSSTAEEVLAAYLYQHHAVAYACAFAGLRLTDTRPVTGPCDLWAQLPRCDCWNQ